MWNIRDGSLQPLSPFYPPLNPQCTSLICDSAPTDVARRISEYLKKQSIVVNYDDQLCSVVSCMTIDRVYFQVALYQGEKADSVIVEVLRRSGDIMSFHRHTRSILNEAQGKETSSKARKAASFGPLELPRLMSDAERPRTISATKRRARSIEAAFERSVFLLEKDRIEAQELGMESLVAMTDGYASGAHVSVCTSSFILECELHDSRKLELARKAIVKLIKSEKPSKAVLRSLALRVLVNALAVLSEHEPSSLEHKLMNDSDLLQTLVKLAFSDCSTAHDAALATRCLRLLASHSATAKRDLLGLDVDGLMVSGRIAQHAFLKAETDQVVALLGSQQSIACGN